MGDAARRRHLAKGWIDKDGELTPKGEEEAERRHNGEYDDVGRDPGDFTPDPYPGGDLV